MHMPPEIVKQLLDAPFAFVLSFDKSGVPKVFVCKYHCTVVWPMMIEAFDVMFSGKSAYVSRRLVSIEPMTTLNLCLFVN